MKQRQLLSGLALLVLLCLTFAARITSAKARALTPDPYEENDNKTDATVIAVGAGLGNLNISPAGDPDWFIMLVSPPATYPGQYRVEVIGTPGLDLTLTLYYPDGALVMDNDPSTPNAAVTFTSSIEAFYAVEVTDSTGNEGSYVLRVVDLTPSPTATPVATSTSQPTATSVYTPTPELGGSPDFAEPNYDFAYAYRIVPGDELTGLNFNSGAPDQEDNDFFVMAVRPGIIYTCETSELGPSADTNIILYWSANSNDVIGGNDDINTQAGQINSRLTFTSEKEGDIYVLVGYKYSETEDITFPGAATYTLTCYTDQPQPVNPLPAGGAGAGPIEIRAVSFEIVEMPTRVPILTPAPMVTLTIKLVIAYDENANQLTDLSEGVAGMSVRVIDPAANRQLASGFTDQYGSLQLIVTAPQNSEILVVVPFLSIGKTFRVGQAAEWQVLLPAANLPGLIP